MRSHWIAAAVLAAWSLPAGVAGAQEVDFEEQVQPVFKTFCYKCHGARKQEGKLRLDSPAAILKGGENGPVIEAGKSDDSLLYVMLTTSKDSLRMPPKGKRPTKLQIDAIKKWIDSGAKLPGGN